MRVLICGGRDFLDQGLLFEKLDELRLVGPAWTLVITGGARGADRLGDEWARQRGLPRIVFPANWIGEGAGAGPLRNLRMLAEGRPDMVVAFPGGKGTTDMVNKAKAAGVPVIEA